MRKVRFSFSVAYRALAVLAVVVAGGGTACAQEEKQAQLVRPHPDSNRVDLVTGGLYVAQPGINAPGAGNMQLRDGRTDRGNEINSLRSTIHAYVESADPDPSSGQEWPRVYTIVLNGMSSRFMCNEFATCDEYPPRRGAALEYVNGNHVLGYIYTASDGTRVRFPSVHENPYNFDKGTHDATEVLYPSGEKISFQMSSQNGILRQWHSNLGYSFTIEGAGATGTRRLYKSGALLSTISSTYEDYANAYNYTRRLTDDLGRNFRIRYAIVTNPVGTGDTSPSISWFEDATGLRTSVTYHRVGVAQTCPWGFYGNLVVSSIQRNGKTWLYSDDYNMTFLKRVTDPTGAVREVLSQPSPMGRWLSNMCTGSSFYGNVVSDKTPLGRTASYTYYDTSSVAMDHPASATLPEGNKHVYEYDGRGNLTKTTHIPKTGGSGSVLYQAGFPVDCPNRKTCNQPQWTRDQADAQTDYSYDPTHGGVLTVLEPADSNGLRRKTWNEYVAHDTGDGVIWRLSATHVCSVRTDGGNNDCGTAAEQVVLYGYWEHTFLPLTVTNSNGTRSISATTTNSYDAWGRVASVTDPTNVTRYLRYDAVGRQTWEISRNSVGSWTAQRMSYDNADRLKQVDRGTLPDPSSSALQLRDSTLHDYDVEGRRIKSTVSDVSIGRLTVEQYSHDAVSRPVCTVKRMNPSAFDSTADACAVGPAGAFGPDRITKNSYDQDGRLRKTVQGFGAVNGGQGIVAIEMDYTNNDQIAWRKDGKGNQTSYVYDGYDRLERVTFPGGSFELLQYDSASRLWKFTKRDGQWLTHGYDGTSKLTSTTFSNGEPTVVYNYDGQARLASIARGGQTLVYGRDGLGRLESESQPAGTVSYAYDLAGRRTRTNWPGGYWVDYDYNSAGELWRMREKGVASGAGLIASFTYDGLGRAATVSRGNGVVTSIARDGDDRLLSLYHDVPGTAQDVQFTFDSTPASQIGSRSVSNSAWSWKPTSSASANYAADGLNRYTSVNGVTYSYDGRGNLTNDGSRSYSYNLSNHVTAVSGGSAPSATLAYDPQNRLFSVAANGLTTRFLYDGQQVIAAYDANGMLLRRYVPGPNADQPMLSLEGAATAADSGPKPDTARWLLPDERGSVIGLANASGSVWINTYGPYGEPGDGNDGRFGYTGQLWLPETGLFHFKARTYHPRLGRFMQTDPVGYEDDANLYAYVGNDPLNFTDPTGESGVAIFVRPTPVFRLAPEPVPPTTVAQGVRNALANAAQRPPKVDPERIGPAWRETGEMYLQRLRQAPKNYQPRTGQPDPPRIEPQPGFWQTLADALGNDWTPWNVFVLDAPDGEVSVTELPVEDQPKAEEPPQTLVSCEVDEIVTNCVL